ncbi:restriction endonuclease subunit S [Providencia rettgeri]|uniref:restriction endonuclease subunit S n=1 Tax=Providencia rettgeri TaxID=587 RepID=UPI0023AA3E24|nr:restriction endonuclease subunit S [Providencia rettgeri]EJF7713211.1 restriction endonuclease subunit S [Providencia rettgeri]
MSLNLERVEWHEFFIEDIAKIKSGVRLTKADMMHGIKPFIGSTDSNNGVTNFISNSNRSEDSNVLGVNYNGSVVENFYHPYTAIFSDDVKRLSLKHISGNKYHYLSLKNSILKQKNKYQYGYKFNEKRLRRQMVMLPSLNESQPNWQFMESYTKALMIKKKAKYIDFCRKELAKLRFKDIEKLEDKDCHEFFLKDIFKIVQRGKRLTKANQVEGNYPYVSSTALNNGVDNFIGNENGIRMFSNCLTVANSGSVGSSFYHPYKFVASDHVTHLQNDGFDRFVYLFIATLTNRLSDKYNFNREINDKRISRDKIMLPIQNDGNPDFEYMGQYMMNKEYLKRKQYLDYIQSDK